MSHTDVNLLTDLLTHRARRAENASVLLIAPPGATPVRLADAIRAAGFPLVVCGDAESGMAAALAELPSCIVCTAELPDADGFAVARWLRAHDAGPLSTTTLLLLTEPGDLGARLQGYAAGADVCIDRDPDGARQVLCQIDALVRFADRGRGALAGDIAIVPVSTLLSVFELERRTGVFEVASAGCTAHLELFSGQVTSARLLGAPAPAVEGVRAMVGWSSGRFCFRATPVRVKKGAVPTPVREVLAEAARLGDEAAA